MVEEIIKSRETIYDKEAMKTEATCLETSTNSISQGANGGARQGTGVQEHKYSKSPTKPTQGTGIEEEKTQANTEAKAKAAEIATAIRNYDEKGKGNKRQTGRT